MKGELRVNEVRMSPIASHMPLAEDKTYFSFHSLFCLQLLLSFFSQVLKVFPYPITITLLQFAVGSLIVPLMWLTGLHEAPKVTKEQVITSIDYATYCLVPLM